MIHILLGTKAQLVKMAPIMVELGSRGIDFNLILTGQHQETMDSLLSDFGLEDPAIVLYSGPDIVSVPQMLLWASRLLLKSIFQKDKIFKGDRNGIVLVHGDTFSTLTGAILGKVSGLKVGHVESGLRSFNFFNPFPEEIIRVLTFFFSNILFCPGDWASGNVKNRGRTVVNTERNTMIDTVSLSLKKDRARSHVPEKEFAIVSLHRFENIFRKSQFKLILERLEIVSEKIHLLFILHPPTVKQLKKYDYFNHLDKINNIELRPRYDHSDFLTLMQNAEFLITDGGSMQEEATYLGLPCLLMRKVTERQEGVGSNVLISNYDLKTIDLFVNDYKSYRSEPLNNFNSPSTIIIDHLTKDFL